MPAPRRDAVSGSNLERVLRAGHFAVCGELGPPQGAGPHDVIRKCGYFKGVVDAVNITDNQAAIVRMSSVAGSVLALREGLEPVLQMTCRDRNRLAQQSDVLGAATLGVRNILCLTGDHARLGNHPEAKPVHDIDATNLIAAMKGLRQGRFMTGDEAKPPPRLFIGGAANPFGEPFEFRVLNAAKKIAAGADFFQTQPVFDLPRFREWMRAVCERGLHERAFSSPSDAAQRTTLEYIGDNVAGIGLRTSIRLWTQTDKEEAMAEGTRCHVIHEVRQIPASRAYVMPVMWESVTRKVVEGAGLLPPVLSEADQPEHILPTPADQPDRTGYRQEHGQADRVHCRVHEHPRLYGAA